VMKAALGSVLYLSLIGACVARSSAASIFSLPAIIRLGM
jgi:hypothetical protein